MDSNSNSLLFSGKGPGDVNKLDIINVKKFLQSRVHEIGEMFQILKKSDKQERVFQKLPFVMRRRAMSHNPFKIPKNIRTHILREMAKSNPKACKRIRKDRRKKLNRLEEYKQRWKKNKWLETHLYHAKRFKMDSIWGYRLALTSTQKSKRRFLRYLKQRCVIHDRSYLEVISVTGQLEELKRSFKNVFSDSYLMFQQVYMSGRTRGTSFCYSSPQDTGFPINFFEYKNDKENNKVNKEIKLIGFVNYIWLPKKGPNERTIWLFIHPVSSRELYNTLSVNNNLSIKRVENLVKFELFGPLSFLLLKNALNVDFDYSCSNKLWDSLGSSSHNVNHSFVMPLFIDVPKVHGLMRPFNLLKTISTFDNNNDGSQMELDNMGMKDNKEKGDRDNEDKHRDNKENEYLDGERLRFFEYKSERLPLNVNNLLRVRKRKDYSKLVDKMLETLSQKNEKNKVKQENKDNKKKKKGNEKENNSSNKEKEGNERKNLDENKVPILVIFRNNKPYGMDVLMPPGCNSSQLWILLNRLGGMSFGLYERETLMNYYQLCSFPQDFPETSLGKSYYDVLFRDEMLRYLRRPPSKRVNYSFLGVDNVFLLPVNLNEQNLNFHLELSKEDKFVRCSNYKGSKQSLFKSKHLLLTSMCSGLYHTPSNQEFKVLRLTTFSNNTNNLFLQKVFNVMLDCLKNRKKKNEWSQLVEDYYVVVKLESFKGSLNLLTRLYQVENNDLKTIEVESIRNIFKEQKINIKGYMRVKEPYHEEYKMANLKTILQTKNSKTLNTGLVQSILNKLNQQGIKNSRKLTGFVTSKDLVDTGVGFLKLDSLMNTLYNTLVLLKDDKINRRLSLENLRVLVWFRDRDSREYYLGFASLMFHDVLTGIY